MMKRWNHRMATEPIDSFFLKAIGRLAGSRYALFSLLIILATLLFIPLRITAHGYRPYDDAMRHAAHALDSRDWNDIVVQREGAVADTSPGWDFLLRRLHQGLGWDQDALLSFSTVFLCLLFLGTGLVLVKSPLAWVATLCTAALAGPALVMRINIGRPFIVTMCCMMAVMMIWRDRREVSPAAMFWTVFLFMLSSWFHGSWYLAALLPLAFLFSGRLVVSVAVGLCWLLGSLIGSTLTGHPFAYLAQQVSHGLMALGESTAQRQLVMEFKAALPSVAFMVSVGLMIMIRMIWGKKTFRELTLDPLFLLFVVTTVAGVAVERFFLDWALPAGVLWMGLQWKAVLQKSKIEQRFPVYALGLTVVLCGALFVMSTVDVLERWTGSLDYDYMDASDPELADWLPGDNGIVYSDSMRVFYLTYFRNPNAPWRYILGYEAGLMPEEDLAVYRSIQWNRFIPASFKPWVEKLRPQDRLLLLRNGRPRIEGVEWHLAANDTWIGRKKTVCEEPPNL